MIEKLKSSRVAISYFFEVIKFSFKIKPILWGAVVLSILSSFVEIFAMALLYPMSKLAEGKNIEVPSLIKRLEIANFISFNHLVMLFLFAILVRLILGFISQFIYLKISRSLFAETSYRILKKVLIGLDMLEIQKNGISKYSGMAGDETFRISVMIIGFFQFFGFLSLSVFYYIAIFNFSTNLFLFITIFLFFCFLLMLGVFKYIHYLGSIQTDHSREVSKKFIDAVNNVKSIRCFNAEEYVSRTYYEANLKYVDVLFKLDLFNVILKVAPILLLFGAVFIGLMSNNFSAERVSLSYIVTTILYISRFFPVLGQALSVFLRVLSDIRSSQNIMSFLKNELVSMREVKKLNTINSIELKSVNFSYDQKKVFRDLNLTFVKGKVYSIVGPSGVGKSTFVDLLMGFVKPVSGKINVNEYPLDYYSIKDVRSKILLVEQKIALFNDTIKNNLTLGSEYSKIEIANSLKASFADDFLDRSRLDEVIQYQGANYSGGQKQRISLARALLRDPDVLILDESFSAMDQAIKEKVYLSICNNFKDKIVIHITHDPWIKDHSDLVYDLSKL